MQYLNFDYHADPGDILADRSTNMLLGDICGMYDEDFLGVRWELSTDRRLLLVVFKDGCTPLRLHPRRHL